MKRGIVILLLVGVLTAAIVYYVYRRRRRKPKVKPMPPQRGDMLSPKAFLRLLSEESEEKHEALSRFTNALYENAKGASKFFASEEEAQKFRQWLEREREYVLKNQDYKENLADWLRGRVSNPLAALIRTYLLLDAASSDVTMASVEALATAYDKSLLDDDRIRRFQQKTLQVSTQANKTPMVL